MASIGEGLALTQDELDEMMSTTWNMRVATVGPGTRINVTPLWFGWGGGAVYFYCRGQKIVNLRRNPVCTVLVDRNEEFPQLNGAMMQGTARILETVEEEAADTNLPLVRRQMGAKYAGGHGEAAPVAGEAPPDFGASARGRFWRWVVFEPDHIVSWDNRKLPKR